LFCARFERRPRLAELTTPHSQTRNPPRYGGYTAAHPALTMASGGLTSHRSVDAVVGADTHRDTHTLEITATTGATLATVTVDNTDEGSTRALAWIAEHAPGPRVVAAVEGSRSYGVGLARALGAAGVPVLEIEQPHRRERRRGKSDPIDAHLAAIHALRLDADQLPTPRADGDREALRILLVARAELTVTRTRAINQLRALLVTGDDEDRLLDRPKQFSGAHLEKIISRGAGGGETREQTVRRAEARRLAVRIRNTGAEMAANKKQLSEIVNDLAPGLLAKRGVGPVSAAQAIATWSHRGRCHSEAAFAALGGVSPLRPPADAPPATGSTAAATAPSTAPCTASC